MYEDTEGCGPVISPRQREKTYLKPLISICVFGTEKSLVKYSEGVNKNNTVLDSKDILVDGNYSLQVTTTSTEKKEITTYIGKALDDVLEAKEREDGDIIHYYITVYLHYIPTDEDAQEAIEVYNKLLRNFSFE